MSQPPRIWLSNREPASDEVVTVRTMVNHPMETGLRRRPTGENIPQNIINRFECKLNDELLFVWEPETAVSQSPYLEFRFIARRSGSLQMVWLDDEDKRIEVTEEISLNG